MKSKITSTPNSPIQIINPPSLYNPVANAYSHIVQVNPFAKIIHISGQGGENSHGELADVFATQVTQVFCNIRSALAHCTATFADVAVLRILIVDHSPEKHQIIIQEMHKIWENKSFPACTLIPVPCLAIANMLVEIEATAYCS